MSLFLNTRGRASLGIALCDRCNRKFPIGDLMSDPNAPGLKVCAADRDDLDPFTLPPRMPENITLRFARPDVPLPVDAPYHDAMLVLDASGADMVLDSGPLA